MDVSQIDFSLNGLVPAALFVLSVAVAVALLLGWDTKRKAPRPVSAKATAEQMIWRVDAESDRAAFVWLRAAGWAVAPFALPVGTAAVIAGNIARAAQRGVNIRTEKMPEDWYAQVMAESSEAGKLYLGGKLKRQGYVTVAQAAKWMELESRERSMPQNDSKAGLVALYDARPSMASKLWARIKLGGRKDA